MFVRVRRDPYVFYTRERKPMRADDPKSMLSAAREWPVTRLPALLGQLEEIRAIAFSRMLMPQTSTDHDELLTVAEAARRLSVAKDTLYRHSADYAFTRKMGTRLRFSAKGIQEYIDRQAILPSSCQKAYTPPTSAIQRKRARKGGKHESQSRSGDDKNDTPAAIHLVEPGSAPQH